MDSDSASDSRLVCGSVQDGWESAVPNSERLWTASLWSSWICITITVCLTFVLLLCPQGHVGTTATKKIDVYLPLHLSQDRLLPMTVVTMASARVQDLIGLICWQYTSEGREPKLK